MFKALKDNLTRLELDGRETFTTLRSALEALRAEVQAFDSNVARAFEEARELVKGVAGELTGKVRRLEERISTLEPPEESS